MSEPDKISFTCTCGRRTAEMAMDDTETCPACGSQNERVEGGMSGRLVETPEMTAMFDALTAGVPADGQPHELSPAETDALNSVIAGQPTKN